MSYGIAEATANSWLDGLCSSTTWTEPAEFWVKLHTNDPGPVGTTDAAANTTRKQPTFSAAASGAITTSADIVWAAVPNTEIYNHLSFWTASAGGTFLGSLALDAAHSITAGQTFTIAAGNFDLAYPVTAPNIAVGIVNSWLDGLCRSVTWTEPAEFWVKLHTGNPGSAGANNAAAETDRQQATFSASDLTTANVGYTCRVATTTALTWAAVSNTETYSYVSFWDASAAGNFLGAQALGSTRPITAGADFTIAAGDIIITIGPVASGA